MAAISADVAITKRVPSFFHAWTLWVAPILVGLASALWTGTEDGGKSNAIRDLLFGAGVVAIPYATVGALVIRRQSRNLVGWLLWLIGVIVALNLVTESYGEAGRAATPRLAVGLTGITEVSWAPAPALMVTLVPLLFPTGRPPGRGWRWTAWLAVCGLLALFVPLLTVAWTQGDRIVEGEDLEVSSSAVVAFVIGGGVAVGVSGAASLASLFVRLRRARGVEREQLKWFAYGAALVFLIVAIEMFVSGLLETVLWFGTLVLPAAIGLAILRYRLFDIDVIISRTLLWFLLTAFVIGTYALVVGIAGSRFHDTDNLATSLIATGLVAVLFQPMRARLQRGVNRLIFGDRDDPYSAIARLGQRLEETVAPGAVLPMIAETVAHSLRLPYAALTLRNPDGASLVVTHGAPITGPGTLTLPLTYRGEPIGQLDLAPRTPGVPFSVADHRLLRDLARQVGVAGHAVQLTTDLQRSRERLVTAREEERRRLRNDLHDGLGPVLSGLKLRAETARNLIRENPEVEALLVDIATRTEAGVADIRRLVYALRPPALDDLGLIPALREVAAQFGLSVRVVSPSELPPLPAAVEVAAFRIGQEALTNVARHASTPDCELRLSVTDSELTIEVVDGGIGLPDHYVAGVGLRSIRERATELSGDARVESLREGGTRMLARLPLARHEVVRGVAQE